MKGVKYNIDGLERLNKNLSAKMIVKTGVLGDHVGRTTKVGQDDIDNATLGALMELGSFKKVTLPSGKKVKLGSKGDRIPPRSWLEVPIKDNFKDYFINPNYSTELTANSVKSFLDNFIGKISVEIVKDGFLSGGFGKWKANSDITIALKRSGKPLVETGQLEKSISSRVVAKR